MDETMKQNLIELETEAEHLLLARHQVIYSSIHIYLFFELGFAFRPILNPRYN